MPRESGQGQYFRKGLGYREEASKLLQHDFHSDLVEEIKTRGYRLEAPGLTVLLAREFGFCYGVDRALDYAYEARERFPDRRIIITGEVIHNPRVNERLRRMGIVYLPDRAEEQDRLERVRPEDVVLLPAFGAEADDVERLKEIGCTIVDTTCGSVLNVWKSVERYARDGFTAVVHGKYWHEETRATCSQVMRIPGGKYIVVLDMDETRIVADYIRGKGNPEELLKKFEEAVSPEFDPERDLLRIGLANQTTMLSSESLAVGEALGEAMVDRYGQDALEQHFRSFDTICSATQDRQDAVEDLLKQDLDLMIVIGGYNSSNTGHLVEMAGKAVPAYHVEGVSDLLTANTIRHLPVGADDPVIGTDWLPRGPLRIGITAGASTPGSQIGRAVDRLLSFHGLRTEDILGKDIAPSRSDAI
jgi:4-hydroxy-3-methylbut-2-enyl diphosphate reductase